MQRQTRKDYRDAIQELRHHPERGFAKLDAIGAVREVAFANRAQAVADAYASVGGRNSLVVCATHDEIDRVTEAIRDRPEEGRRTRAKHHPQASRFAWLDSSAEDLITGTFGLARSWNFTARSRASRNTNRRKSCARTTTGLWCARLRGCERTLTGKQAKSFDVMEAKPIDVAPGDRLLLTANRREEGLRTTNGELVTVTGVDSAGRDTP